MKIPTYEAQTARPRQGSGQMLTARLSSSAMEAPGRTFAQGGQQLAAKGDQIAEFAYKKAIISADDEADKQAGLYEVMLAAAADKALATDDMVKAEKSFAAKAKSLASRHADKLTSTRAKSTFKNSVRKLLIKQNISFNRAANRKVVDQGKARTGNLIAKGVADASNTDLTETQRAIALFNAQGDLVVGMDVIGAEQTAKNEKQMYFDTAVSTLANLMSKRGSDPTEIVMDWAEGRSTDAILSNKAITGSLNGADKAKIQEKMLKLANKIEQDRAQEGEDAEKAAEAGNQKMRRAIINAKLDEPGELAKAKLMFETLLERDGFPTTRQRKIFEDLLGIGPDAQNFAFKPVGEGNSEIYADLLDKAGEDSLSQIDLNSKKGDLEQTQYAALVKLADADKNDAVNKARKKFGDTFGYFAESGEEDFVNLSRQSYRLANIELDNWLEKNRKAGPKEIEAKVNSIRKEARQEFMEAANKIIVNTAVDSWSQQGPYKLRITKPTFDNFDEVRRQIGDIIAESAPGSDFEGLGVLLRVLNKEFATRGFD